MEHETERQAWEQAAKKYQDEDRIVREKEALTMFGGGRTALHDAVKDGTFPPPRRIGLRSKGWFYSEIRGWMDTRPIVEWAGVQR